MSRKTIHIVDDDLEVREATGFLLRSLGYRTQAFAHGREFLDRAQLEDGCVLLDLRMPDLSGFQILEALHKRGSSPPVIMLSGHGDIPIAVQALKLGATDFLEKPYKEAALIDAVELAFDMKASHAIRDDRRLAAAKSVALLSARESQVLRALLAGLSNKEIARRLDLSPRTVEMHRASMMNRLAAASLAEAIRLALDAELKPLDEDGSNVVASVA